MHISLVIALLIPVGEAIKSGLFDRHLVYLVPPDRPPEIPIEIEGAPGGEGSLGAARAVDDPTGGPTAERAATPQEEIPGLTLRAAEVSTVRLRQTELALTEVEVDSAVVRDPTSSAPEYPPLLLSAGIAGQVTARYVVDTLGVVDTLTYRVMESSRSEFAEAVRRALPGMHFRPAMRQGKLVRQWVEQTFHFRIQRKQP